ncbi:hypothetical protein PV08_07067 [Exophiala spinifera]|uniref:Uncharacterized protein n=1 Tax=Exophiala spinifera TaxID=91928 RepID=A0A0D2B6G2_9EURO|nr:uncharacterized protein PV08_07067 [Exophiala spinifera]KIW14285.1 hypothetical protein PV08_07067 [Exophiala spinifera]
MTVKVALVTASSAGLGAAAAKGLARAGFDIVVNYNSNKTKADAIVTDILRTNSNDNSCACATEDPPRKALAVQADMSRREDIDRLVDTVVTTFGRLDCVVSNQGWTRMRQFDNLDDNIDEGDWDICYNMNVKSHLYLFHAARPHLAKVKGSFTSVASLAGVIPSGSSIPYSVTKAAQIHLIKALSKVAAPEVRVNSVSPGILLTDWGKKFPETKVEAAIQKSTLKRLAEIDDVVQQIVLFATKQSYTGQNVVIDAGWSLG